MAHHDKTSVSRRHVVHAASATLAAASLASSTAKGNTDMAEQDLIDPVTRYPKPPFKKQSQPWPGLAGKMEPRPDHGETSYKGSGRLAGRKALITGGDSGMGRAAAIAYAREGADVAINYLPAEEPDAQEVIALIKAEGRNGLAIPGDLRDEAFCKKLVEQAVAGPRRSRHPRQQRRPAADPRLHPRRLDGGFRRDDEDQHLRAVLDHQGGAAASEAGLRASSARRRSRPTIPRPISTTMRRPRRRR